MDTLHKFDAGGYAFLEGGFPYSQGVAALAGYAIVRVRFRRPVPVAQGFDVIARWLEAAGRPSTALAAAELRSPVPFTVDGFRAFNEKWVAVLERWGLIPGGRNAVARSNVCPVHDAPAEPGFHAFSYTVHAPDASGGRDYVVAGSGEWPEKDRYPDGIIAHGDTSPAGLAAKATYVLDTMAARCAGLCGEWTALTGAQVYTAHDIHPLLATHFAPRGLTALGLTWQVCRPPIVGLEFEMDVRSVLLERVAD